MTPELISRVDTVLASWCPGSPLAGLWRRLAATWFLQHENQDGTETAHAIEAAMRGVLLALVREAWGASFCTTYWLDDDWRVEQERGIDLLGVGPRSTEDEALVVALEAAPEVPE